MFEEKIGYVSEDINLDIGEKKKIKLGFIDSITLIYSGMPSKDVFSITVLYGSGYQGYAYTIFYPNDQRMIKIDSENFNVVSVKSDQLILRKQ